MIHHKVDQDSPEWRLLRMGRPTASEFHRIITPGGKKSVQMDAYANKLIAEILKKEPINKIGSTYWLERGKMLEPEAVHVYELTTGLSTEKAGFITDDLNRWGCSPDRLVGDVGMAEFKVPTEATHIGYLLSQKVERKYYPQIQGQLYIAEREWNDFVSYCPGIIPSRIRVQRDESFIKKLEALLMEFREIMNTKLEELIKIGAFELPQEIMKEPPDVWSAG